MTMREGFQNSVNLVFIRLMRDVVTNHLYGSDARWRCVLDDPRDPRRDALPDALRRPRGQRVRPPLLPEVPGPVARAPWIWSWAARARPRHGLATRAALGLPGGEPRDLPRAARRAPARPRADRQDGRGALRARGPAGDAARRPRLRGRRASPRAVAGGLPAAASGRGHHAGGARQQRGAPGGLRLALLHAPPQRAGQSHREPARDRGLPRSTPELGATAATRSRPSPRRSPPPSAAPAIARPRSPS